MGKLRNFSLEFKRQVVQEYLSGESGPAQLCRRYNISSSLLYHWKKQYSRGKFDNEPNQEAALKDRVDELERLVGRLTLENEFLKRGCSKACLSQRKTGVHRPMAAAYCRHPAGMQAYETPCQHFLPQT
jgi:transposase